MHGAGSGQQGGLRAGTLDVCGIEMFVRAAESMASAAADRETRLAELNMAFEGMLEDFRSRHDVRLVGDSRGSHIHMLLARGYEGAVVSRILAQRFGIMVASSSACSAEHGEGSRSMRAMGYGMEESMQAIRISMDDEVEKKDIARLFQALEWTLCNY